MSRRSTSAMGPPPDRDVVMGPPPSSASTSASAPLNSQKLKETQDVTEKYKRLKRKYFELEEKQKETAAELTRSGERNLRLTHERKIIVLETGKPIEGAPHPPQIGANSFPRPQNAVKRDEWAANLQRAVEEDSIEDRDIDPLMTSRHVGPVARKRQEEEEKERQDEELREARRAARKARPNLKGKDLGAPLTFAPSPSLSANMQSHAQSSQSQAQPQAPLLVSSTGTRLRIKPPAPPADPGLSTNPRPPSLYHHVSNSSHSHSRSGSPISPMISPGDGPSPPGGHSPSAFFRNPSASTSRGVVHSGGPSDIQRQTKPKRLKAHTVTSRSYSIPMVPRDKKGGPMLPLNVGIMTVVNLGEVCMREHFHTERYIYPVGYEVTRRYLSTLDPNAEVVYHCTILDGGDGPKFQIISGDMPDNPIIAGTASGAWSPIVKAANNIRNRQHSNSVSGPDYFGLGQNTIKHLIQQLSGADKLRDYVWQNFVEGGPLGGRHAAVIPALPEEFDSTMPLGAYYPSQRERERERERERDRERYRRTADDREPTPGSRSNPSPAPSQNSRGSPIKQDDFSSEQWASNGASNGGPMHLHSSQSPALSHRTQSQSPALYREQSLPSQPYTAGLPINGAARPFEMNSSPPPPPVPATFASIMNEYPLDPALALPSAGAPAHDFVQADAGGSNGREPEFGSPNGGFTSQYQSFPPGDGPER